MARTRTAGSALRRAGYEGWLRNVAVALGNAPPEPAIVAALTAAPRRPVARSCASTSRGRCTNTRSARVHNDEVRISMFTAKAHSLLVPHNGRFDARNAPTLPEQDNKKSEHWKDLLQAEAKALGDAQYRLYADGRHAVLLVFQALDAAGKDSTIRHVFAGVNPCGLDVRRSSAESRGSGPRLPVAHQCPSPGARHVAVFNRSYYEEVLVVRVHPSSWLRRVNPRIPRRKLLGRTVVVRSSTHERHLAEQGTVILKFWLNVSKNEQRKRLLERIDDPGKNWKFNAGDLDERDALGRLPARPTTTASNATSRPWAPWYAIPADNKHYVRWQVAKLVNDAFAQLGLDFPRPDAAATAALAQCKARSSRPDRARRTANCVTFRRLDEIGPLLPMRS